MAAPFLISGDGYFRPDIPACLIKLQPRWHVCQPSWTTPDSLRAVLPERGTTKSRLAGI